jgi:hypothetical protein
MIPLRLELPIAFRLQLPDVAGQLKQGTQSGEFTE